MHRTTKIATATLAMANAMEALDVQPSVVDSLRREAVAMVKPAVAR